LIDENRHLTWKWKDPIKVGEDRPDPSPLQRPKSTLCFDFAELADRSDEQIRRFAARWGPLGFENAGEERLDDWRYYARIAQAILRFSAQRLTGGTGLQGDWNTLRIFAYRHQIDRTSMPAQIQMAIVGAAINRWYAAASGHRIMDLVDNQLRVGPGASNLFGILITQIAHAVARCDQTAVCAGCQCAFIPKRPLSRGSRQYCKKCRRSKVPQRDASRDWRRRQSRP
jgi:hypothetical protein